MTNNLATYGEYVKKGLEESIKGDCIDKTVPNFFVPLPRRWTEEKY